MAPVHGQTGFCGNFNGRKSDDAYDGKAIGRDLGQIPASQSFFGSSFSLLGDLEEEAFEEQKPRHEKDDSSYASVDQHTQSILDNCSPKLLKAASKTCDHIIDQEIRKECKFDVCYTGHLHAAEDSVAMEIMEVKGAHGVIVFLGHGRCLDHRGRFFTQFQTHGQSTTEKCQEILQGLSWSSGVRGAELSPSRKCLIVVDRGIESIAIPTIDPGLSSEAALADGEGMVSNTTLTEGWNCWKLI